MNCDPPLFEAAYSDTLAKAQDDANASKPSVVIETAMGTTLEKRQTFRMAKAVRTAALKRCSSGIPAHGGYRYKQQNIQQA